MELTLTKSQKQYLNKKGAISSVALQKAYKNSVKEQLAIKKTAEKLRKTNTTKSR